MFKKVSVLLTVLATVSAQNITENDVISLVAGMMNGIVHQDHLDYMLGCMTGTEGMAADIENALAEFSHGDVYSIAEGLLDFYDMISLIPAAAHNCGSIPDDINKMMNFFSVFNNATLLYQRLEYNLLWNYSDIMAHATQAMTDYANADFFDLGDNLGDALVLAVGDNEVPAAQSSPSKLEILRVLASYLAK